MARAKADHAASKTLYENGRLFERDSYLGMDGHLYLVGKDVSAQREYLIQKLRSLKCAICRQDASIDGEMDHIVSKGKFGCDCLHNLQWLCPSCHRSKHVAPRFGESKKAAEKDFNALYPKEE